MVEFSEKVCVLCKSKYIPTSPKQKACSDCRSTLRKIRQAKLDKIRNRQKHNILYTRVCPVCSITFETYDIKKKYCGSEECNRIRIKNNDKRIQAGRKDYLIQKNRRYYVNNKEECRLKGAARYRAAHPEAREYTPGRIHQHSYQYVKDYVTERGYTLISTEYKNNKTPITLLCPQGHTWVTTYHSFEDKSGHTGNRCMTCYIKGGYTSRPELQVRTYIEENHPDIEVVYNDRSTISPFELDLYFPKNNLAIEVCGLYWHSELGGGKSREYHYNKMKMCEEKGVRLITVFEDELFYTPHIVMSRISQALGRPNTRVFARKCTILRLDSKTANDFFLDNHIQGSSTAVVRYGLFYQGELIAVASLGNSTRAHTAEGYTIEFKRFCTKIGYSIPGGIGKLFKVMKDYAIVNGFKFIKSHCDMRYANIFKPVYSVLGFDLVGYTKYTPHYIKDFKRYRNQSLRKTTIEKLTGKTEWELRKDQGYDRIWDCGHRTYVYTL